MIDDQLAHLADDADDMGIRALVAETPGAGHDYRQAQAHADAMAAHRHHVVVTIPSSSNARTSCSTRSALVDPRATGESRRTDPYAHMLECPRAQSERTPS